MHSKLLMDSKGHQLLLRRLADVPGEIAGMMVRGLPQLRPASLATEHFLVTGTGSSEAHARYFCNLINLHTDRTATYLPLSGFLNSPTAHLRERTLVVFSQGLSPNAQIALRRHREFAHCILFSATTPLLARAVGKMDRADLITAMVEHGGDLVLFPLGEEYSTLIRFVGPLCGYLAVLQAVAQLAGSQISLPKPKRLLSLFDLEPPAELLASMKHRPEVYAAGFNLLSAAPITDYAQNLSCKFMEGLFWGSPQVSDFLQFAHGPFQQSNASHKPVLILQGGTYQEQEVVERSLGMIECAGLEAHVIKVAGDPVLSIFGFEQILNRLVMELILHFGIDQVNWPGKGRDDMLYGFCADAKAAAS